MTLALRAEDLQVGETPNPIKSDQFSTFLTLMRSLEYNACKNDYRMFFV